MMGHEYLREIAGRERDRHLERLIRESVQLQWEVRQIARGFNDLIVDVQSCSPFTVSIAPGKWPETIYPKETQEILDKIKAERDEAIKGHIEAYELRRQGVMLPRC